MNLSEVYKPRIEKVEIQAFIGDYRCPFTYEETSSVCCTAANEEFYALQKNNKIKNKTIDRQVFEYDDCNELHAKSVQNYNICMKKALLETMPLNLKTNSRRTNLKPNNAKSEQRYKKDLRKDRKNKTIKNVFTTIDNFKQLHSSPSSKERIPTSCKAITYEYNMGKYGRNFSEERSDSNFETTFAIPKFSNKVEAKSKIIIKQNKPITGSTSFSTIFNSRDINIQLSNTNSNKHSTKDYNSKQRKKSKPKMSSSTAKFNKSVLDKKINFCTPNMSQDYTCQSKAINKANIDSSFQCYLNEKLKNSKSSGKLSKNSAINRQNRIDNFCNKIEKKFYTNTSCSKGREKSNKKTKENEFRKLLRPMHTNQTSHKMTSTQRELNLNQFHIKTIKATPSADNNSNQIFDNQNGTAQIVKSKSDHKVKASKSKSKLFDEKASSTIILREKCLNSIKCDLWLNIDTNESKNEDITKSPEFKEQNNSLLCNQNERNSVPSVKEESNFNSSDSTDKLVQKKHQTKTPPPEKAIKLDDIKFQESEVLDTKDTSTKRVATELAFNSTEFDFKSLSSLDDEPKSARDKIDQCDQITMENHLIKKESKDTISLMTKPPVGSIYLNDENSQNECKETKVKQNNFLMDTNEEIFSLLDNKDGIPDFVSSISSSSSQLDYDKMAMEAMAEVDCFDDTTKSRTKALHDYKGNKWEGLYNKKGSVNEKKDNIHMIEEDIENEIDSEYSVTLKKGEREHLVHKINKEIEADKQLFKLNSSKEFTNLNDSISSIGSSSSKSIKGSCYLRRTRDSRKQSTN